MSNALPDTLHCETSHGPTNEANISKSINHTKTKIHHEKGIISSDRCFCVYPFF